MTDLPSTASPVKQGDVLAGKYRVDRVIGVGGMGVVVAATHEVLEQKVALKFLHGELAQHPEAAARFAREAKAAVKIRSEHVCRVTDVGKLDNGAPYMVMEFLEGEDLGDTIDRRGALDPIESVDYVLQALEAIAEAHAAGIVHRDLKPPNLFLAQRADGSLSIKVLDFGISKLTDSDISLTKTSSVMGSPQYMAPEQMASSKRVDARTDIWAIGTILYELLTGKAAFQGETVPEVAIAIVNSEPESLSGLPHIDPGLVAVVEHCLKKKADERPNDVGELAKALAPFGTPMSMLSAERTARVLHTHILGTPLSASGSHAAGLSTGAFDAQASPSQLEVSPTVASYTAVPLDSPKKSRVGLFAGLGVGALLLLGGGAFLASGGGGNGASAGESKPAAQPVAAPVVTTVAEPVVAAAVPTATASEAPTPEADAAAPAAPAPAPKRTGGGARPAAKKPPKGGDLDLEGFGDRK